MVVPSSYSKNTALAILRDVDEHLWTVSTNIIDYDSNIVRVLNKLTRTVESVCRAALEHAWPGKFGPSSGSEQWPVLICCSSLTFLSKVETSLQSFHVGLSQAATITWHFVLSQLGFRYCSRVLSTHYIPTRRVNDDDDYWPLTK